MAYIQRDLEARVHAFLDADNGEHIVLLGGARQTGKSTLAENLPHAGKKLIINLWDEEREVLALRHVETFSEFEHILQTVFGFTPGNGAMLIIDEAQASEHISSFLMEMNRKWQGQRVVLLGSLLANLYKKGQPMPVGRTVEFICRPLNFKEFLRFCGKEYLLGQVNGTQGINVQIHLMLMDEYRKYLQIGGLPGMVNAYTGQRDLVILFESLLGNLYRDADRFIDPETSARHGKSPQYGRVLETVLHSIAHHIGSATQNTTLLSSDSPAYRTVLPPVLEALGAWHLAYTLSLQTAQLSTKKGYGSKKYLFDTGIANFMLTRLGTIRFNEGDQAAAMLLENGVLQDCVSYVERIDAVRCYRSSNRVPSELDFLVSRSGSVLPLEVKSSSSVKLNTLSQLVDYLERSGAADGYVVYTGMPDERNIGGKTIHLLPPYLAGGLLSVKN
jgi:predicted AAA+ superfamily ATPase